MQTKEKMNIDITKIEKEIFQFLCQEIRSVLLKIDLCKLQSVEEIRLRAEKPLMINNCYGDYFVDINGEIGKRNNVLFMVTRNEIIRTLELMSENSIYAYQDEIKHGFITLRGGHRVGICGRVVMEGNSVKNIKDISGLNIRISREITGCSEKLIKYIIGQKNNIFNTLIISPPQCGKTTILRDVTRIISEGFKPSFLKGLKVGVVDERSEIAACFKGVAQNDVGVRTDVLDGCPKVTGMNILLRSMSPQVIVTDEIGNTGDRDAIMQVINAGVKIISSAHGYNISELKTRKEVLQLIEDKVFERYIVLSNTDGPGTLEEVIDGLTMENVYKNKVGTDNQL